MLRQGPGMTLATIQVQNDTTAFTYGNDRVSTWQNQTDDLWLWGYWAFDWADSIVKVGDLVFVKDLQLRSSLL